ncbi:hypothetical protein FBU30_010566 [Linnemannia zychae]|nr:hypothetical protein FBU30_010566 [Linnemannia zychae]
MTSQPQLNSQKVQLRLKNGLQTLMRKSNILASKNQKSEKSVSNITNTNTHQQDYYNQTEDINIERNHASKTPKNKSPSSTEQPKWRNWMGNQTCNPEQIFNPVTLEDLVNIVHLAKKNNKKIRCAGSGKSFSSCSVTDDYLVSINKMEKIHGARKLSITEIDAVAKITGHPVSEISRQDSKTGTPKARDVWAVTIESGVCVKDLDKWLKTQDPPLTLPSNVVLNTIRYGGILSMGCHGAATHSRTLSDLIHELTIVDSNGDLQTLSSTDETRADEFSAACVSLGLMGIIYTYTLRVEPMDFRLQSIDSLEPMTTYVPLPSDPNTPPDEETDCIAGRKLRDMVLNSDQTEIMYWVYHTRRLSPQKDKLWIKQWQRTDARQSYSKFYQTMKNIQSRVQVKYGSKIQCHMTKYPRMTPLMAYLSFTIGSQPSKKVHEVPSAIHYEEGETLENLELSAYEFSFKCDNNFVSVVRAWRYVVEQAYMCAKNGEFPVHVVEMRFLRSSSSMMSNMYDNDPDAIYCALEVIAFKGTKGFEEFASNVGQYWMKNFGARPHWAKAWEDVENVHQHLLDINGGQIQKFNAIRKKADTFQMASISEFQSPNNHKGFENGLQFLKKKPITQDFEDLIPDTPLSTISDTVIQEQSFYTKTDDINTIQISSTPAKSRKSSQLRWKNYMGNQTCNPEQIFSPATLEDLINIVYLARNNSKKIRCVGSGKSFSSCSVTDGYLVKTHKLKKIHGARKLSNVEIDAVANITGYPISEVSLQDSGTGTLGTRDVWVVTFESGINIRDLDEWLRKHEPPLALPSNVVMDTHGAATHSRTLSDLIHELTIVDSNGDLQTLSSTDGTRADEFSAACVSLGLMGIIYTYTLRVEPMDLRLRTIDSLERMTDYFPIPSDPNTVPDEEADRLAGQKLREVVLNNDQSQFIYWPYHAKRLSPQNDKLWIKKWQRTDAPRNYGKLQQITKSVWRYVLTRIGTKMQLIRPKFPQMTPLISYISYKFTGEECKKVHEVPDAIHFYGRSTELLRLLAPEFAFKCDDDFVNVIHAWRYVVEQAYSYAKRGEFPVHLLEMRFMRSSSSLMSNLYDSDPNAIYCTLEIVDFNGIKDSKVFFNDICQYWMKNFDARPHWAKIWESIDNIEQHLLDINGDRIQKFNTIRKKYDPDNMFLTKIFKFLDC